MCMTSAPCSDARFYSFFGAAFREQARKLRDGRHWREAASFPWEGNGFAKVDAAISRFYSAHASSPDDYDYDYEHE
jgi:hypothetical protein